MMTIPSARNFAPHYRASDEQLSAILEEMSSPPTTDLTASANSIDAWRNDPLADSLDCVDELQLADSQMGQVAITAMFPAASSEADSTYGRDTVHITTSDSGEDQGNEEQACEAIRRSTARQCGDKATRTCSECEKPICETHTAATMSSCARGRRSFCHQCWQLPEGYEEIEDVLVSPQSDTEIRIIHRQAL